MPDGLTTPAEPPLRDDCVIFCVDCDKEFGPDPTGRAGLRLTCDKGRYHIAAVIKKSREGERWPAKDWLFFAQWLRERVNRGPRRLGFSGERAGKYSTYRFLVLSTLCGLAVIAKLVIPTCGSAVAYVCSALASVLLLDILLIATWATFVSRFPANSLRSISLTIFSFVQVAIAYATFYSTFGAQFCVNNPKLAVWPLYFSFVTITTLGYGDIHPNSSFAALLTVSELVIGLYTLAVLLAVVGTWANDPPRQRQLISEYLRNISNKTEGEMR